MPAAVASVTNSREVLLAVSYTPRTRYESVATSKSDTVSPGSCQNGSVSPTRRSCTAVPIPPMATSAPPTGRIRPVDGIGVTGIVPTTVPSLRQSIVVADGSVGDCRK